MEQTNEAIIGSHNSMSYLRPANWWGWLLRPFARCQAVAVEGQIAAGARCFDLRISFDCHGLARFRHGWCRFGGGISVTDVLALIDSHGGMYVRLILEEPHTLWNTVKNALGLKAAQQPDPAAEGHFTRRCALYQKIYRHTTFIGGYRKFDWARLYDFGTGDLPLHQWVSSMDSDAPWWQRAFPRIYARRHNPANMQKARPGINLFDFV